MEQNMHEADIKHIGKLCKDLTEVSERYGLNAVLREVNRQIISQSLIKTHGNQTKTAELLGINRATVRNSA